MAQNKLGYNQVLPIYNADGTPFNDLVLKKSVVESVVMSLCDKITGDVLYKDNTLAVTMNEYVMLNGVKYVFVNPPTVVRWVNAGGKPLLGLKKRRCEEANMFLGKDIYFVDANGNIKKRTYKDYVKDVFNLDATDSNVYCLDISTGQKVSFPQS